MSGFPYGLRGKRHAKQRFELWLIPFGEVCTDADSLKALDKCGLKPSGPLEFDIGTALKP